MNDKGFVNGNGMRRNSSRGAINGLTNGKGNKDGLVNGNGSNNNVAKKGFMSSPKGRAGAWIVIGVVLLLIFGAFAVSTNSMKKTDWNSIRKYIDFDMSSVNDKNINIEKFAFHKTDTTFEFYLNFEGDFSKTAEYQNLGFILIDNDSNPNTGYSAGYLGADYVVEIYGNNGTISATFSKFSGGNPHVWNWTEIESVAISHRTPDIITGAVNYKISSNAKIMVLTETGYYQDITPVVGIQKPALLVIQTPLVNNTLRLDLKPMYSTVNVKSITLQVPMGVEIKGVVGSKITGIGNITTPKTIYLRIDTSNVYNRGVEVKVLSVETNAVYTIWGNSYRKYVGTPDRIVIDGYFKDWDTIKGINTFRSDTTGDVANPNIDLYLYSNYTDSNGTYFYASVTGTMLAGNIAPVMEKAGHPWGNTTVIPKGVSPCDYAQITFTTKNHQTHVIQVYGYNGKVIKVLFDGKETNSVKVGVGRNHGSGALEIGIDKKYDIVRYSVKMTDWNGESDYSPVVRDVGIDTPEFNTSMLGAFLLIIAVPVLLRRKNRD